MPREVRLLRPAGPVPYAAADAAMHALVEERLAGRDRDTLVLLEHPPVFTAGRASRAEHVRWGEGDLTARGVEVHHIDRGGSLTFHGPGQLVGYPILDLGVRPDAIAYVRSLEEVVMRAGARLGVALERSERQTGVWSGDRKVCAIGVRIARMRVSLHGFALNCTTDLSWYEGIVPCGIGDAGVTSLSELAGRTVTVADAAPAIIAAFEDVFDARLVPDASAWPAPIGAATSTATRAG